MNRATAALLLALVSSTAWAQVNAGDQKSEASLPFNMTTVATFTLPWRMAFLPDGRLLVNDPARRRVVMLDSRAGRVLEPGSRSMIDPREMRWIEEHATGDVDHLLLGTDLIKDRDRLEAAYDDAAGVTADFNKNVLEVLNRELGADFDLDAFDLGVVLLCAAMELMPGVDARLAELNGRRDRSTCGRRLDSVVKCRRQIGDSWRAPDGRAERRAVALKRRPSPGTSRSGRCSGARAGRSRRRWRRSGPLVPRRSPAAPRRNGW